MVIIIAFYIQPHSLNVGLILLSNGNSLDSSMTGYLGFGSIICSGNICVVFQGERKKNIFIFFRLIYYYYSFKLTGDLCDRR